MKNIKTMFPIVLIKLSNSIFHKNDRQNINLRRISYLRFLLQLYLYYARMSLRHTIAHFLAKRRYFYFGKNAGSLIHVFWLK